MESNVNLSSSFENQALQEENVGLDQLNVSGDSASPGLDVKTGKLETCSVHSSGDNADVGNEAEAIGIGEVKCDDCSIPEPIRQWRWCGGCERVLCETCAVEGHQAHIIESYASGVRRSDDQHRQVMEEVRLVADQLAEGGKKAEELQTEIFSKLSAIKRDMRAKIDETKDIEDTLNQHLASMIKLEREPLSAKTWTERRESVIGAESLIKVAFDKQHKMEAYLNRLDGMIDEGGRKLGKIFRENE